MFTRILTTVSLLSFLALGLSACNTAEGVGEDLQAGGEAISDTADDAKDSLD